MQKIFGDFEYAGPDEGYGDAYIAWLNRNMAWLEQNKENMYSAWTDVASAIDAGMQGVGRCYEKNGEIILEAGGRTTEELVQLMTETTNLTETQARMMIADFKNYSADFAHEMAQNDLANSIRAWAENARTSASGAIVYTEQELKTLASVLGVSLEDVKRVLGELDQELDDRGNDKYTFTNIVDLDTSDINAFIKALKDLGYEVTGTKDQLEELAKANIPTDHVVDVDGLKTACDNLQLNFEDTLKTNILNGLEMDNEQVVKLSNSVLTPYGLNYVNEIINSKFRYCKYTKQRK